MMNINITVDVTTLRKKLKLEYRYEDIAKITGLEMTKVHRFLNNNTKAKDINTFIRLCLLADIEPMDLIKIEYGEN